MPIPTPLRVRVSLCALLLVVAAIAHAQLAVYGTFEGNHFNQGSTWKRAGTLGIYDDFFKLGPLRVGADVRGTHIDGSDSTDVNQILGGLRVAVKPPVLPIGPYAEVLGGGLRANSGPKQTYAAAEINGGVDFTFFPHLDWRIAEIGGQVAGPAAQQNFHISTGLVLRFF